MKCKIFNCDKRRGNYCCRFCKELLKCKNSCKNKPEICNLFIKDSKEK